MTNMHAAQTSARFEISVADAAAIAAGTAGAIRSDGTRRFAVAVGELTLVLDGQDAARAISTDAS